MKRLFFIIPLALIFNPSANAQKNRPATARTNKPATKPEVMKSGRDLTLREFRSLLVGKKVVIRGRESPVVQLEGTLAEWFIATEEGGRYEPEDTFERRLPITYRGQEADVIAVQVNRIERERSNVGKPNALGETPDEDSLVNPYADVVVRLADGTLALTTNFPSLLLNERGGHLQLAADRQGREGVITAELPSVIGKTVYAAGYSRLYPVTATMDDLLDLSRDSYRRVTDIPRLQPLTITAAKYNAERDVVVLKLKGADGREYLTASDFRFPDGSYSFFDRLVNSSPAALDSEIEGFTPGEIAAIRSGSVVVGMSHTALYSSIGFPEKENDWGRGGKQLIYYGGKLLVYLDANKRVRDWQNLGR